MTSLCECGCGQEISPLDPCPFFKKQSCQRLWMWSQHVPEHEQARKRSEMRFFHELWTGVRWSEVFDFFDHASLPWACAVANTQLGSVASNLVPFRLDRPEEEQDALRVAVYRWNVLVAANDNMDYLREEDMLPDWVWELRKPSQVYGAKRSVTR